MEKELIELTSVSVFSWADRLRILLGRSFHVRTVVARSGAVVSTDSWVSPILPERGTLMEHRG